MLIVIAVLVFAAVTFAVAGLFVPIVDPVQERVRLWREERTVVEKGEPQPTFGQRVMWPLWEAVARRVAAVLPPGLFARLRRNLTMAGNPMSATTFLLMVVTTSLVLLALPLMGMLATGASLDAGRLLWLVLLVALGAMLPFLWLRGLVRRRQAQIVKSLPDSLDLITTCVEAGLGLDAALTRVAQKMKGPLAQEMTRALREMGMGRMRRDALRDLGQRTGVDDVITFVHALIQAEQMGVSIGQVLRVQADQMRTRRRQRAEQAAYQAPVKMVFPLVLCIFPSLLVVILGPGIIKIAENLTG